MKLYLKKLLNRGTSLTFPNTASAWGIEQV